MAAESLVYPTAQLRERIEAVRVDPDLSAGERLRRLFIIRDEAHSILGLSEAAIGDARLEQEAGAAIEARDLARAREDADVRAELERRRLVGPDELDEMGVPTHAVLDMREADGTIGDYLCDLRESTYWREWLYRRTPERMVGAGQFAAKPGQAPQVAKPKARGGTGAASPGMPTAPAPPRARADAPPVPDAPEPDEPERERAPDPPAPDPAAVSPSSPDLGHVRTELQDQVLGRGVRDTAEKHSKVGADGVRRYTPERREEHRQWALEILGDHAEGHEEPEMLFTAGGPASGKSSIIEPPEGGEARVPQPEDAVHLDQDIVKAKMEEYRTLADQRDPYASDAVHREAADVYRVVLAEAMRRRMNIISEGTGNSGEGQFVGRIRAAKEAGYRTRVIYASAPTSIAEERAQFRAKKTGRAVPVDGLRAMHANVSKRFSEVLAAQDAIDELTAWDTRGNSWEGEEPTLMIAKGYSGAGAEDPSAVHVADEALLQQFVAKAGEDPGALIQLPTFL